MDTKQAAILTIADSPDATRLLNACLSEVGYHALNARDGYTEFKLAVTNQPDLILLDIIMPEMSRDEIIQILKAEQKTQNIPIRTGFFENLRKYTGDENHGKTICYSR